jgi:FtsZ-binding cell division protein ZapB
MAHDRQLFLNTEVDALKTQLQQLEQDKQQSYEREERICAHNHQFKT